MLQINPFDQFGVVAGKKMANVFIKKIPVSK
jgi:glucose-6-phosphate isomerase